jgi:hypothetical protein
MRTDRLNACLVLTRAEMRAYVYGDASARAVVITAAERAANRLGREVHVIGPWAAGSVVSVKPTVSL